MIKLRLDSQADIIVVMTQQENVVEFRVNPEKWKEWQVLSGLFFFKGAINFAFSFCYMYCIWMHTHICIYPYVCLCTHVHMPTCMHVCVCMNVQLGIYLLVLRCRIIFMCQDLITNFTEKAVFYYQCPFTSPVTVSNGGCGRASRGNIWSSSGNVVEGMLID